MTKPKIPDTVWDLLVKISPDTDWVGVREVEPGWLLCWEVIPSSVRWDDYLKDHWAGYKTPQDVLTAIVTPWTREGEVIHQGWRNEAVTSKGNVAFAVVKRP